MPDLWNVPESCRCLPAVNLEGRLWTANELIKLLRNPASKAPPGDSREEWTRWIKENLYSLIDRGAYGISPDIADSAKGEYLTLDITVEEKNCQWRVVLAVESELDDSRHRVKEILKDFEKLLAVKSAFKLMIFSSQKRGLTNEEVRRGLQNSLDGYSHHICGETYIFIDYNENNDEGVNGSFIAHVWQPESNGPQKPAKFFLANAAAPPPSPSPPGHGQT
jgi:hypothetical protein